MVRIEVVSFDMEGTLIDDNFSDLLWEHDIPRLYGLKNGLDFEAAKAHVLQQYDTIGVGNSEWYDVDYWFRRLGLRGDWRELLENRQDDCRPYPETIQVLERLRERYTIIICSNTIREFLEVQLRKLPRIFGHVFSAPSDFGTVKNPEFYRRICNIIGVEPGSIAHVGDNVEFDYEAAREVGIHAFYLDRSREAHGDHVLHGLLDFEERLRELDNRN